LEVEEAIAVGGLIGGTVPIGVVVCFLVPGIVDKSTQVYVALVGFTAPDALGFPAR
jgi:hypothetical protein